MPSLRNNNINNNSLDDLTIEDLFKLIEETKEKEITNFGETILHMEQRYAHFISSALDVKKRICMEVYTNKINRISELCTKSLSLMNNHYTTQIKQLKKEKKELIRKNRKISKLLKQSNYYSSDNNNTSHKKSHKKKKKHKSKSKKHKSKSKSKHKRPSFNPTPEIIQNDSNNISKSKSNDGPNDIITDIIMNDNYAQLQFDNHKSQSENNMNFHAMPTFAISTTPIPTATISQMNSVAINDSSSDSNSNSNSNSSNTSIKKDISHHKRHKKKRRHIKKRRHRHRHIKKEKYKYKYQYRKLSDERYTAPPRGGDTDKTWLYCNHTRSNGNGVCGVKFIRTLKDREDQAQHYCDGDNVQKLITRKFGSHFTKCQYCDGISNPCTRLASIDEIELFQKKLKQLKIIPNTYGGFKKMGAKQTISQLPIVPRGKGRKRINIRNDIQPIIIDDDSWNENDDGTTESDINLDNKPLQRNRNRNRKRKRREFEGSDGDLDSELSDTFVEQELKKQKLDKSELRKLELDELLSKAFGLSEIFEWDILDKWCRYCGARGSDEWLNGGEWGVEKLCKKHGELYREGILDLNDMNEPIRREDVGYNNECTEREYLIEFIDRLQKIQFKAAPAITIDGKRRSLRNIKRERRDMNERESDSDGEESYVDTSGSGSDDDDDMQGENRRDNNGYNENGNGYVNNDKLDGVGGKLLDVINTNNGFGNEDVILNVKGNVGLNSIVGNVDEDDDILGVD